MKNTLIALSALSLCLAWLPARAELQARDFDGDLNTIEAFYDTDLSITWLADVSAAQKTGPYAGSFGSDGKVMWVNAKSWADSLTLGGATNWRLPKTSSPDSSCNLPGYGGTGQGCTGSEMGHLNNVDGVRPQAPKGFTLFQGDEPNNWYWSQDEILMEPGAAYAYNLATGVQGGNWTAYGSSFALAVHDGDVGTAISPIPEPKTYALMLTGLAMLGFVGRGTRRHS